MIVTPRFVDDDDDDDGDDEDDQVHSQRKL